MALAAVLEVERVALEMDHDPANHPEVDERGWRR
jgi:hypothetical protein